MEAGATALIQAAAAPIPLHSTLSFMMLSVLCLGISGLFGRPKFEERDAI
jgi:hypothetical protein